MYASQWRQNYLPTRIVVRMIVSGRAVFGLDRTGYAGACHLPSKNLEDGCASLYHRRCMTGRRGLGNIPDGQIPHTPQNHLTKNASYLNSCQNHKSASSTGTYAVRYVLGMLWSMQDSGAF